MAKFIFQWDIAPTRTGHNDAKLGNSGAEKMFAVSQQMKLILLKLN